MRLPRRRTIAIAALGAVALGAFVLAYFEPQKLFIDDRVAEALPMAPASGVKTLATGAFRSYEHATTGRARVIAAGGKRYVRFDEGFETSNGPALKVYLSAAPASGPGDRFDDRFVDLGDLKGNIGSQNYAIPSDVRLDRYRSVVVWCVRFHVPFAAAAL
jgi:electron transfer DM13